MQLSSCLVSHVCLPISLYHVMHAFVAGSSPHDLPNLVWQSQGCRDTALPGANEWTFFILRSNLHHLHAQCPLAATVLQCRALDKLLAHCNHLDDYATLLLSVHHTAKVLHGCSQRVLQCALALVAQCIDSAWQSAHHQCPACPNKLSMCWRGRSAKCASLPSMWLGGRPRRLSRTERMNLLLMVAPRPCGP